MYIVELHNGETVTEIHGPKEKLKSGNVVKGINAIDSFSFTLLPSNKGFDRIRDFQTQVTVYNTNRKRYEFLGRVLYSKSDMDSKGLITKEVTCESYFGFLCDSVQKYVEEQNWTVTGLLQHIIDTHNSQVEAYKRFTIGEVTVTDPNDNLYIGIQRENTWKTIEEKLIKKLGGEIRFRVVDGMIYLDYLTEIGEVKATKIEVSRNMKAITQERDPSAYVTRLIPLGCKLKKEVTYSDGSTETVESEERLDITSVNNGIEYIDDVVAVEAYGIHVGYVEFDDVTDATNLLNKGKKWLIDNNKIQVKYSITALDLSLLGLDIDDFDVHNYHPILNPLLSIDDTARITKKDIDVCEEIRSTVEVGDNFKTLSDIQQEQAGKVADLSNTVGSIKNNYVTNEKLKSETSSFNSLVQQQIDNILLSIEGQYMSKDGNDEFKQSIEAQLQLLSDTLTVKFSETVEQIEEINGDLQSKYNNITKYFTFTIDGMVIGAIDNPNRVVIDNDEISILVNGVVVQRFDANGKALIPELNVTKSLDMFGYLIDQDSNGNVNCGYAGGV